MGVLYDLPAHFEAFVAFSKKKRDKCPGGIGILGIDGGVGGG